MKCGRVMFAAVPAVGLCVLATVVPGCGTPWPYIGGAAGLTAYGGQAPSNEVQQVYYLGIFDPQEQLPPAVYRVTVRGQASALSATRFASGWVPANVVDTLNTTLTPDAKTGAITVNPGEHGSIKTGRRLVLFGPEGFREAPKDHRLVIVMGSDPSKYFEAVGTSLGEIAQATLEAKGSANAKELMAEYMRLQRQADTLSSIERRLTIRTEGGAR
ncbi:MAG: hypothetical protein HRU70_14875 [Phycisphaeraceae bacterium]|nr:MAG: hypothetical protein HRU70_14875 [Phycisphaeraceae bacterium]